MMHAANIKRKCRNTKRQEHFEENPEDVCKAIGILYDISSQYDARYLGKPNGYQTSLVRQIIPEMLKP